jgi:hypothetical protein
MKHEMRHPAYVSEIEKMKDFIIETVDLQQCRVGNFGPVLNAL